MAAPVVLLHGSNTSTVSFGPLLEHLDGLRVVAVDRPGFGSGEPVRVPRAGFRDHAVASVDEVLGPLAPERPVLVGSSMGGTWALWYTLARPERVRGVALVGSAPLLPGTRAPAPLRVAVAPVLGDLLARVARPGPKTIVRLMSSMGEGDTIGRHPALLEALVAGARDPVASATNLAELRACIATTGFVPSMRIREAELRRLAVPVLLIWGDHDPVGSVDVARATAGQIPDARLEVLPAGHVPYLGHPERVAALVREFAAQA